MIKEKIKLIGGVEVAEDIKNKMKTVGVRGLDVEKAKELGFFLRISYLLCAAHASVVAAYRIYGQVDYLLSEFGGRKNDIAKAMGIYEKAFNNFINFWTDYYASGKAGVEMGEETENLYHRIMKWAQLPETWNLGDKQRIDEPSDVALKIQREDNKDLYFHKSIVEQEVIGEPSESWCVTKYDVKEKTQETVNTDMDKASAMMVAKRLSKEDEKNIYTASIVREIMEKRIEVVPFKAFLANETVGKITNIE